MYDRPGQPTKYNEDICGIAEAYINDGFIEHGDTIPQAAGMAQKLEVSVSTLYNWGDAHPEFLEMLKALQDRQSQELINKGLDGTFNSAITKLVLTKHGYHDKQDSTVAGPDGKPVAIIERHIINP